MRRYIFLFTLSAAALFAVAGTALADNTATLTLTGVNGAAQGGFYVSPYTATIDGVSTTIFCDDFVHDVGFGETWTANVSHFDSLTKVRFQDDDTLQDYDEAAFLMDQSLANPSQYGNIQYAIWAIFNPSQAEANPGFTTSGADSSVHWLNLAGAQTFRPGQFSNFLVYTPTNSGSDSAQEFIAPGPSPTPEPSTLILLGSGLLAFLRKRKKR